MATETAWDATLVRLDEHRLMGLAYAVLARAQLIDVVPPSVRRKLWMQFELARARCEALFRALRELADALAAKGVQPIVCKGVLLAREYYPESGARYMNDLDLWVDASEESACLSVLDELGYTRRANAHSPKEAPFENRKGVVVDLHTRMELFESQAGGVRATTQALPGTNLRVFEPHALLAHLCAHLGGHERDTGPMLCWFFDIAYVLNQHGAVLDLARLRTRMPSDACYRAFLRIVVTAMSSFGFQPSAALASEVRDVAPYPLEALLRLRRTALFGVGRARGWATLAVTVLGLRDPKGRIPPTWQELSCWSRDRRAWGSSRFWRRVAGE
jgi:hypothetical protein